MKSLLIFILFCYRFCYSESSFNESEVVFRIFGSPTLNITYKDFMVLRQTAFDKNVPTVYVVHGFRGQNLLEEFELDWRHLASKMNLIGIDWSAGSSTANYTEAAKNTETVGSAVGHFIMGTIRNRLITNPESVHIVGHGLGAHIAGFAGKHMAASEPYPTLRHITALDPARPCFEGKECPLRLCVTDATFVETIHTDPGWLGMYDPIGSFDIYIKRGSWLRGECKDLACSHLYAHQWYRKALKDGFHFDVIMCIAAERKKDDPRCNVYDDNPLQYKFEILREEASITAIVYKAEDEMRHTTASPKLAHDDWLEIDLCAGI